MSSFVAIGLEFPQKKMFEVILPYMGMAATLVMWPELFINTLVSLPIKFDFDWPSVFRKDI